MELFLDSLGGLGLDRGHRLELRFQIKEFLVYTL